MGAKEKEEEEENGGERGRSKHGAEESGKNRHF